MSATPAGKRVGGSAVVVGASMAGLCAARALSERFEHVVVLDRDRLPEGPDARGQVPQGRHPHLLLLAGARLLEQWFPGIIDELESGGATAIDLVGDVYWHQGGGVFRRPRSSLVGPGMSRPFLEWTVRRRVAALPNVTLREGITARGLQTDAEGGRVVGVSVDDAAGGDATVSCDLMVDATGKQARSLGWLEELGYEPPPTSVVEIDTKYVSQVYRRSNDPARDWKAAGVIGDPASKRLAMALPLEGDRWIVCVGGLNGESAPLDEAERRAYVRTLDSAVIADLMESSEPIGEPAVHRFPANRRRHLERMRRYPVGWVLLGDSVCCFDPIYGQGMTSAAQQARALGRCLDRTRAVDRRFARRYFKAVSKVVAVPWSTAVGGDFAYDGTVGKKPPGTDLVNRYMDRIFVAAQHDDSAAVRVNEVVAMVRSPFSLMAPAFVLRVLRAARRGPVGPPVGAPGDHGASGAPPTGFEPVPPP
jgi:2-polyprenyl-6-methoxyphenol hydroxylase-like FAD-dependent oxidoreductase